MPDDHAAWIQINGPESCARNQAGQRQRSTACNGAEGPDLSVTEPVWRSTAAGMARYHHQHDILALLEAK
jgi:hypothetical protein